MLLDEPTAALDPGHRLALWALLERVGERGGAVAFATQNVEEARLAADSVLVLVDGRCVFAGPQEAFWREAGASDERRRARARVRRLRRARGRGGMRRFALLLRKDLLLLARSRPLVAVLVVYPLVLSLLVGGVLGGQGERPRVAFVNEDSIPDVVHIGDRSFDFGRIVRSAGKQVQLVDMPRARARAALAHGDVVAAIIVPRGFVSDLASLIASPSVLLLTNRNAYEDRILRETQSFVYTLNSQIQTEYIQSNSHFLDILVSGGKAEALGPQLQRARPARDERAHPAGRGAAAGRQPGAHAARLDHRLRRAGLGRARAGAPGPGLDRTPGAARAGVDGRPLVPARLAGAELRPRHLAGVRDAAARRRRPHARARRERARPPAAERDAARAR